MNQTFSSFAVRSLQDRRRFKPKTQGDALGFSVARYAASEILREGGVLRVSDNGALFCVFAPKAG